MVSGRPLLYLSLPGVAFILGVFWFRRRNKNRTDDNSGGGGGDKEAAKLKKQIVDEVVEEILQKSNAGLQLSACSKQQQQQQQLQLQISATVGEQSAAASKSMNINGCIPMGMTATINGIGNGNGAIGGATESIDSNPKTTAHLFGKSAPIKIQNNGRHSPAKQISTTSLSLQNQQQQQQQQQQLQNNQMQQQIQQIDSEVLKNKIQDAEHKLLRSIDEDFENLSSPVDLPDSINNRVSSFYARASCNNQEPVVIKATRTPKISPENSFLESKYTKKECEQNNNCDETEGAIGYDNNNASDEMAVAQTTQFSAAINVMTPEAIAEANVATTSAMEAAEPPLVGATALDLASASASSSASASCSSSSTTQPNVVYDVDKQMIIQNIEEHNNDNHKRNIDSASPALSLCSVQSADSGKGSSLPRSEATHIKTKYEFFFPNSLIGQLYGRKRSFINQLKSKTSANVVLSRTRYAGKVRICTVEGTESEINAALIMIRQRLPVKRYPHFSMQRIHFAVPQTIVPLSHESLRNLQLKLIEGINNDVVVSAVISGGHIFIQHPLHPSHPALTVLQKCLYDSYTTSETPLLPGIEISAVCVMPVNGMWYRVQIVEDDIADKQRCVVKFLDFGGYMNVNFNELRQIRSDFMGLPFQATECILSNIAPAEGTTTWSVEAAEVMCKLSKGIVLQAQVAGYNMNNVPEIFLFATIGPNTIIFINKELVARNLAQWVELRN